MSTSEMRREQIGDMVPVIAGQMTTLTDAVSAGVSLLENGLPDASSRAMAELADERRIAEAAPPDPVHAAHGLAGILSFACADFVRQFAHLFSSQPVPVYAHLPVVRGALEAGSTSYWLTEFPIGAERRVQRLMLLQALNAHEMKRGPVDEFKAMGRQIIRRLRESCDRLFWVHNIGDSRSLLVAEEKLPSKKELLVRLFQRGHDAPETGRIGLSTWWYTSGVQHAVMYALVESIEANEPLPGSLSETRSSIYTSSRAVLQFAAVLALALDAVIESHRKLFGRSSSEWDAARQGLVRLMQEVIEAGKTGLP